MKRLLNRRLLWGGLLIALLCGIFFVGNSFLPGNISMGITRKAEVKQAARENNSWNHKSIDSAIILLKDGDLVMRQGIDISSFLLAQMNLKNKTFSHCGVVIVEHGYPFVYHCLGGEDNPNEEMRRDSVSYFLSPVSNFAFGITRFDFTPRQVDSLKKRVVALYKEKVKFDMQFDLKTDDRLYCAEFVCKTFNKITGDSCFVRPSRVFGYSYVAIDNLFINPHARMIWQVKYK